MGVLLGALLVSSEPNASPCQRDTDCAEGHLCFDQACIPREQVAESVKSYTRATRFGLKHGWTFGIGGALDNPSPGYELALDFSFPTGSRTRHHIEAGYFALNGYDGVKVSPLVIGYSIPIRVPWEVALEVEVVLSLVQAEILFDDAYSISLSSRLGAQLVLVYEIAYFGLNPVGLEFRYAHGIEAIGIRSGLGVNWPLQFVMGVEL